MLWDARQRGLCYHVDGVVRGRGTGDAKGTRLGEPLHITRRQIGHKLPDLSLENGHASHRFSANTSVTFTPSKLNHRVPEFASMCSRALRSSSSIRTASPETAVCTPTSCTDSVAAMRPACDDAPVDVHFKPYTQI